MNAVYGLFGAALLIAAAASLLPVVRPNRRWLAAAVFILALLPLWAGESAAQWLHGNLGAPSFTLCQLALLASLRHPLPTWPRPALAGVLLIALLFYTLALGLGPFDPYGLGYRQPLPLLLLLPLAFWLWRSRRHAWLYILTLDLTAYASGLFANYWDALFDPLLFLLAAIALLRSKAGKKPPAG